MLKVQPFASASCVLLSVLSMIINDVVKTVNDEGRIWMKMNLLCPAP